MTSVTGLPTVSQTPLPVSMIDDRPPLHATSIVTASDKIPKEGNGIFRLQVSSGLKARDPAYQQYYQLLHTVEKTVGIALCFDVPEHEIKQIYVPYCGFGHYSFVLYERVFQISKLCDPYLKYGSSLSRRNLARDRI